MMRLVECCLVRKAGTCSKKADIERGLSAVQGKFLIESIDFSKFAKLHPKHCNLAGAVQSTKMLS